MEILEFKTNINDGACVNVVSQEIDKVVGIKNWEVETAHSNKTLTVRGNDLNSNTIIKAAKKAGFKAEYLGARASKR